MNVADYAEWLSRPASYEHANFRRVLSVPIKSGAEIVGVLWPH